MAALTVALLQLASAGANPEANLAKGEAAVREAAARGADLALFPELWQIGYALSREDRAWLALATERDGPFVTRFRELARELGIAVAVTYLERWAGAPRNAATVVDATGRDVLTYAKVHTCDFDVEAELTPGDEFRVAELETAAGPVRIGVMTCYDREFPEAARILMLRGAEVVLVPNACELTEDRVAQLRARAFENMVGVALTNYAEPDANGRSLAFDGMACAEDESPRDQLLLEAGAEEGVHLVTFDVDALRAYRRRETWGDAYRKPSTYGDLALDAPAAPFERADARR